MGVTTMTLKRMAAPAAATLLLVGALAIALVLLDTGSRASAPSTAGPELPAQVTSAEALTAAPSPVLDTPEDSTHSTVDGLRQAGARLARPIPLPPGGSFDAIDWTAAAAQGGDSDGGIQGVLEYQASCQWYVYALANASPTDALMVISTIAKWPTFRINPANKAATAANVAAAFSAGDTQVARDQVAANCR